MASIIFVLFLLFLFLTVICLGLFLFVFYAPHRKMENIGKLDLPSGEIYEPFHEKMKYWAKICRDTPHEEFHILSHDGLNLYAKYYEYAPGAPIEIMFHGYRGSAERDLSGGMNRCFKLGHSALIVDQRCAGKSDGHVITFGIQEHRDCLNWINFAIQYFGPDVQIILTGISMGASTVLMASGQDLPSNVIGVLADCGFNSAKDVIIHVARSMHLPAKILYPFVKLSAKLFGHFDLEEMTSENAVRSCKIPVIFFHGENDDYVPSYMSRINYDACASRKKLVIIPDAGHGLSYPVDPDRYIQEAYSFFHPTNG